MKVVLFCGGFGTRLREYSDNVPKPLVPIGPRPIVWNLMKYYAHFGHKEFILCLGYRGQALKEFFLAYDECLSTDFRLSGGKPELMGPDISDWKISFIDTGLQSNIAKRLQNVREHLDPDEPFLANYSDGLSNLPLPDMIDKFQQSDAVASFLAVRPSNSLSKIEFTDTGHVRSIDYLSDSIFINGGFFVLSPKIFDYMEAGEELVEEPFERLIKAEKLMGYKYDGFWRAMDTFKDKKQFDEMYDRGDRPWEVWSDTPA